MLNYAKSELAKIPHDEDGTQSLMDENILEIVEKFSDQEHSGFSANYAIHALERLLRFKPLTPLTGEDDEWERTHFGTKQNKRCSSVFLNEDGTANDINAIVVSDNGGIT